MSKYPLVFKLKVVSDFIDSGGESVYGIQSRIAKKYGISLYSLKKWVELYQSSLVETKPPYINTNELESLREENKELRNTIAEKELQFNNLKNVIQSI